MWIFLSNSFLSIVDKGDPGGSTLLVRARKAGDIEAVFPHADVIQGGGTDYEFRARIDREEVAKVVADQVRAVTYPNFKSTVAERDRHDAYMHVWDAMYSFQKGD
jgi:hypothetical protein